LTEFAQYFLRYCGSAKRCDKTAYIWASERS
jgi:hypothetical protein